MTFSIVEEKHGTSTYGNNTPDGVVDHTISANGGVGVVGEPGAEIAHVYRKAGASWPLDGDLSANAAQAGERFGTATTVYGSRAVVGAPKWKNGALAGDGRVQSFLYDGLAWNFEAEINLGAPGVFGRNFGGLVALYGNTLAAAAAQNGSYRDVTIWTVSGGVWTLEATLVPPNGSPCFGLAIYGDTVVWHTSGTVYVSTRSAGVWSAPASLDDTASLYGGIDLYADRIAVGSDNGSTTQTVRTYTRTAGVWSLERTISDPLGAGGSGLFGQTQVALSDTRLMIGDRGYSSGAGRVYCYLVSTGALDQNIDETPVHAGALFGECVALDGDNLLASTLDGYVDFLSAATVALLWNVATLDFDRLHFGESLELTAILANDASQEVTGTIITASPFFLKAGTELVTVFDFTIGANQEQTHTIVFKPTIGAPGARENLLVATDQNNNTAEIELFGTAGYPVLQAVPAQVVFGPLPVGVVGSANLRIENVGDAPAVGSVTVAAPFAIQKPSGSVLSDAVSITAKTSQTWTITYTAPGPPLSNDAGSAAFASTGSVDDETPGVSNTGFDALNVPLYGGSVAQPVPPPPQVAEAPPDMEPGDVPAEQVAEAPPDTEEIDVPVGPIIATGPSTAPEAEPGVEDSGSGEDGSETDSGDDGAGGGEPGSVSGPDPEGGRQGGPNGDGFDAGFGPTSTAAAPGDAGDAGAASGDAASGETGASGLAAGTGGDSGSGESGPDGGAGPASGGDAAAAGSGASAGGDAASSSGPDAGGGEASSAAPSADAGAGETTGAGDAGSADAGATSAAGATDVGGSDGGAAATSGGDAGAPAAAGSDGNAGDGPAASAGDAGAGAADAGASPGGSDATGLSADASAATSGDGSGGAPASDSGGDGGDGGASAGSGGDASGGGGPDGGGAPSGPGGGADAGPAAGGGSGDGGAAPAGGGDAGGSPSSGDGAGSAGESGSSGGDDSGGTPSGNGGVTYEVPGIGLDRPPWLEDDAPPTAEPPAEPPVQVPVPDVVVPRDRLREWLEARGLERLLPILEAS